MFSSRTGLYRQTPYHWPYSPGTRRQVNQNNSHGGSSSSQDSRVIGKTLIISPNVVFRKIQCQADFTKNPIFCPSLATSTGSNLNQSLTLNFTLNLTQSVTLQHRKQTHLSQIGAPCSKGFQRPTLPAEESPGFHTWTTVLGVVGADSAICEAAA